MFPARLEHSGEELARNAQPGPRYTSYPPATQFRADFGEGDAYARLAALSDEPLSLYAHIPFCSQLCWYCGCNVIATRDRGRGADYVDVLVRELALVTAAVGHRLRVAELALGGGSPNFLEPRDLMRLVDAIRNRCTVVDGAELGLELDPRDTSPAHVEAVAALGFTRISVGVQDFDADVQRAIHRHQTVAQTRAVVERARACGVTSVNVDLVYGLPAQSVASLGRTLAEVIALAPDRVAVFGYAHLPLLRPHQRLVDRAHPVPGLLERAELLRSVLERLDDAGYVRVGLDHFARPSDPLVEAMRGGRLGRNFQGYVVQRTSTLLGLGASAISDTGGAYWQNAVDLEPWSDAIRGGRLPVARGVALDDDDRLRRTVIMRLMCEGRVRFDEHAPATAPFATYFARELAELEAQHGALAVVDRAGETVTATPLGHHLIRNVARVFDRYAREGVSGSPSI